MTIRAPEDDAVALENRSFSTWWDELARFVPEKNHVAARAVMYQLYHTRVEAVQLENDVDLPSGVRDVLDETCGALADHTIRGSRMLKLQSAMTMFMSMPHLRTDQKDFCFGRMFIAYHDGNHLHGKRKKRK